MNRAATFTATSASNGVPVRLVVSDGAGGLIEHRYVGDGRGGFKWVQMPLGGTVIVSAASRDDVRNRTRTISIVFHGPRKSWCMVDESVSPGKSSRGSHLVEFGPLISLLDKFESHTRLTAPVVEIMKLGVGVIRYFAGAASIDQVSPWALKAEHTYEVMRDQGVRSWFRVLDDGGPLKVQFLDSYEEDRQRPVSLNLPLLFTGSEILTMTQQGVPVCNPAKWLHEYAHAPSQLATHA